MDEVKLRSNCRAYVKSFAKLYPDFMVTYAGKAFCNIAMVKLVEEEGLGLDVVSGDELYTAIKAGFPADKIIFSR